MANLSNLNNRFIVSDAGHVSIGNVTTNTYLVHAKSSAINNAILALESSSWQSGASAELRLSYVAGHERSIKGGYSTGLEFYTNNATPAISILPGGSASGATGNVGIGVATATTKLHIGGTAPGDSIIRQDSTVSGTNWEIGERAAGKWQIFEDDGDTIVATFMSTGNVGIGTNSPTTGKLVVKGSPYVITDSGRAFGGID